MWGRVKYWPYIYNSPMIPTTLLLDIYGSLQDLQCLWALQEFPEFADVGFPDDSDL